MALTYFKANRTNIEIFCNLQFGDFFSNKGELFIKLNNHSALSLNKLDSLSSATLFNEDDIITKIITVSIARI